MLLWWQVQSPHLIYAEVRFMLSCCTGTPIDVEDPNEFSSDVHAVGQILYHCLTSGKYRAAWRYDFKVSTYAFCTQLAL